MTCPACHAFAVNHHSGRYRMECLQCCARLLASTRPNRHAAAGMMTVIRRSIERSASTFGPADVTACARQMLEKPR